MHGQWPIVRRVLRDAVGHVALVLIGLFVGLVLLEALLQVGALYVRLSGRGMPIALGTGPRCVVCLGDSNTYGVYVDKSQAWPAQLEAAWNADGKAGPIQVLNLGFPGTNSSRVRNQFPRVLEAVRPSLVLIMIGINDIWIPPEPLEGDAAAIGELAWRYSRVYRFGYMLAHWLHPPPPLEIMGDVPLAREWRGPEDVRPDVALGSLETTAAAHYDGIDIRLGAGRPASGKAVSDLGANLEAVVERARRDDVPVALVTYPSSTGPYGSTSERLRQFARRTGVPVIDVGARLAERCGPGCPGLLFSDGHPRPAGHAATAQIVMHELRHRHDVFPP